MKSVVILEETIVVIVIVTIVIVVSALLESVHGLGRLVSYLQEIRMELVALLKERNITQFEKTPNSPTPLKEM